MKIMEKAKRFFTLNAAKHEGFTLVELIVVIAILAILAGVAVPAYSGYIEKSKRAGDETLLAAVNKAFASACLANNIDIYDLEGGQAFIGLKAGTKGKLVDITTIKPVDFQDEFEMFYDGNEGAEFQVIAGLYFHPVLKQFVEMSEGMSNILSVLTGGDYDEAIKNLKDSIFPEIGFDSLANQIDNASDLLAGWYGHTDSGFHKLLDSDANTEVLVGYLSDDEDEAEAMYQEMFAAKLDALKADPKYAGMTETQLKNMARGQIMSNTAILTAAQNKDAINDGFIAALGNGSAVSLLQGATDGGAASEDTIAQAAFAYAMYTSYQASKDIDVSGEVDIYDVYNVLGTEDFQNYIKNDSQADRDGYLGAMELIAAGANNADSGLAQDILMNGFNSSELVGLMQNVTK